MNDQRKIALYAAAVFLSSALLMVLELLAARLIAPHVGVSLYTWSAVIGVVLAGLSAGNALGGIWADRRAGAAAAGTVLLAAGITALLIPWLLREVAGSLHALQLSILSSSLLLVLCLFFVPALLIGVVTPLLTTLALAHTERPGHVVGMMHALGASGSIIGTFAAAWWLIPWMGSRDLVLLSGAILLLLGGSLFLPLRGWRRQVPALLVVLCAGALGAVVWLSPALASPCERESSYFCIRTVDEGRHASVGQMRSLVLDHLLHGTNAEDDGSYLHAPYTQLMRELACRHHHDKDELRMFFVGGGAYTQPRAFSFAQRPVSITVAELDPLVTQTAIERLFLDPQTMRILHGDARAVLQRLPAHERFEIVVGDAFHDIAVPYHLVTREFAQLVQSRLSDDGVYVLNLVDVYPRGRLMQAMLATLRSVFAHVDVWLHQVPDAPSRVTYVISASNAALPQGANRRTLRSVTAPARSWVRITDNLQEAPDVPVLTDDRAPVEQLISSLFTGRLGR